MRNFNHWTPLYIWNRSKQWYYEKLNPDAPWLTQEMIGILKSWLKPTDVGMEWGSGRSTIWFAKKVQHITSVEDNGAWAEKVCSMIKDEGLETKARLLLHLNENGNPPSSYVAAIDEFSDESLDFCLVDGDLRDQCALQAVAKIRPGGILVIDNIERYLPKAVPSTAPNARNMSTSFSSKQWECFVEKTKEWRCIWTSDGVSDTALWIKPFYNEN